jgi:chemotaxis protein MotB
MADGSGLPVEQLIIIRRGSPEEAQAKGGAWKIAYADFVTAMMAFFLVMWLINAANEKTKAQVASYFNPVKLVDNTTSTKGLKTPGDRTVTVDSEEKTGEADKAPEAKKGEASKSEEREAKPHPAPSLGELQDQILRDPYVMLGQLAGAPAMGAPEGNSTKRLAIVEQAEPGKSGGRAFRDPFDPLAWKSVPQPLPQMVPPETKAAAPAATEPQPAPIDMPVLKEQPKLSDNARAKQQAIALRNSLQVQLHDPGHGLGPNLDVEETQEGVLISLTDNLAFDMFDVGSVKPRAEILAVMDKVAAAVKAYPGKIVIRGHTDARRYRNGDYDNWRLSTARAQMAYYMLTRAGVGEAAIERIEGYADRNPKNRSDPEAPENRRIEILLKVDAP